MFAKKHVPFMLFILATSVVSGQPLHEMGIMQQFKKLQQKYSPQLFIAALLLLLNIPLCIGQVHTGMALDAFKQHGISKINIYTEVRTSNDSVISPKRIGFSYTVWKQKGKTHVTEKMYDIFSDKIINTNKSVFGNKSQLLTLDDRGDDEGSTVELYSYNSYGLLVEIKRTICYSLLDCETEYIKNSYDKKGHITKSMLINGHDTIEETFYNYDSISGLLIQTSTINRTIPPSLDTLIGISWSNIYPARVHYRYDEKRLIEMETRYSDSTHVKDQFHYNSDKKLVEKAHTNYSERNFAEFLVKSIYDESEREILRETIRPLTGILLNQTRFYYDAKGLLMRTELEYMEQHRIAITTYEYD